MIKSLILNKMDDIKVDSKYIGVLLFLHFSIKSF